MVLRFADVLENKKSLTNEGVDKMRNLRTYLNKPELMGFNASHVADRLEKPDDEVLVASAIEALHQMYDSWRRVEALEEGFL